MRRQGISPGRIAVMVGFALSCFALLLFLWVSFGGSVPLKPKGYRVQVSFPEAAQLAEQADVRVAGVTVGKVVGKKLDPQGNRTIATLQLKPQFAPLHSDARAILRQKTLLGETYVEMTTGSRDSPTVPEGGRLANGRVAPTVELDEILRTFDPPTRRAFQAWQHSAAKSLRGRGQDFNDALGSFGVFAENAAGVFGVLDRRRAELRGLVRNTGTVFGALSADEQRLQAFITQTRRVFDATASRRDSLAETIRIFPTFLDESKATLARLRTFALRTDPLVRDLGPVAHDLQPTLRDLRALSPDLTNFFDNLGPLITASRRGLPALARTLRGADPLLAALGPFLEQLNPILDWLQLEQQTVSDFISVGGSALALKRADRNPNANGHALPQMIMTGSQTLVTPTRSSDNRGNSYIGPGGLADARVKQDFFTLPNWDCNPSGGETQAKQGVPGCFVQGPIPFQGRNLRFPHVLADDYGAGG